MNKNQIIDIIRSKYPSDRKIRAALSRARGLRTMSTLMSEKEADEALGNPSLMRKAVNVARIRFPKHFKKCEKNAGKVLAGWPEELSDRRRKRLMLDMLFSRFAYGFQPDEYLFFDLESRDSEGRRQFISDTERYYYVYRMNDLAGSRLFNNKGLTYDRFQDYYKRDAVYITGRADFEKYRDFVEKHPVFVRKNVFEGMGRSVELTDLSRENLTAESVFEDIVSHGPHILEEKVVQSDAMARFNESSVNTVRLITIKTREKTEIPYTFMKVGREGSFIDNGGAGGILVGIDRETGITDTPGYDEWNICYNTHPDHGAPLTGVQLPDWEQALEMCREMASAVSDVKYIGWDLAHTDNGWVLIEGNGMSQLVGPQIIYRKGIKKEFLGYMEKMDLIF